MSAQGFYSLQPVSKHAGQVALVVNTASECGYTPQYKGLQELYTKYKEQGFTVLGFPSNDFGAQEPGSDAEIKNFCEMTYRTTFPLFPKDAVKGGSKQAAYKYLTENAPQKGEVEWNFEKFLVDKKGNVVARFKSAIEPMSQEITAKIEELLQ